MEASELSPGVAAVNMPNGVAQNQMPKILVKGLNFRYGSFLALKNVGISVPANKITALIGPSGCGKSTFLRCLNLMNEYIPNTKLEGEILLDGENLVTDIDRMTLRKRVGMVFQKPTVFDKSIYENVAYGPRAHGTRSKAALDEIVERCLTGAALWTEVKDKLKKSAHELSGGQQQRLCIARTLAVQPEVILMDEPCSALDPVATARIEDLMLDLKQRYTIVIVTHNMQQAQRASDFTGFFLQGELIEYAPTEKIFLVPAHKQTEDYISGRFG